MWISICLTYFVFLNLVPGKSSSVRLRLPSISLLLLSVVVNYSHKMAAPAEPTNQFADINFEEITEATALEADEIKVLKLCFNLFDVKKQNFLSADDLDDILRAMGFRPSKEELQDILEEIDEDGSGEIEFAEFCQLCAKFLVEEPDEETMKAELKEAFRVYDK